MSIFPDLLPGQPHMPCFFSTVKEVNALNLPTTSRRSTIRQSYSSGRGRRTGLVALMVDARCRPRAERAAPLARRSKLLLFRGSEGISAPAAGAGGSRRSTALRSIEGRNCEDVSSFTGDMGNTELDVSNLERTMDGGADQRPGRGSERLRRRFAWDASSSSGDRNISSLAGGFASTDDSWISTASWRSMDETEDNRRIRMLGCRAGYLERCDRPGLGGGSFEAGCPEFSRGTSRAVPAERPLESSTSSIRSMTDRHGRGTGDDARRKPNRDERS